MLTNFTNFRDHQINVGVEHPDCQITLFRFGIQLPSKSRGIVASILQYGSLLIFFIHDKLSS